MSKATTDDLMKRAQLAIDRDESFIYDIAAEHGQDPDNVKHMSWFKKCVAEQLINDYSKYSHLSIEE